MSEHTPSSESTSASTWSFDLRPIDTTHAISAIRKYLEIMEEQIPLIQNAEMSALEGSWPEGDEEQSIHSSIIVYTENLFEEDLIPTMRYSSIVFLHTVFETRLRDLCNVLRRDNKIPISLLDLKGSAIDQAKSYLTKMANISVATYPEWSSIRSFQKIRNCVVHEFGFVEPKEEKSKDILKVIQSDPSLSLNHYNRIIPTSDFCKNQLKDVESFLLRLMGDMGWKLN